MTHQSTNQRNYLTLLLLLPILLLGLGLRLYRLDAQSLWNDEGSSVAVAQRDLVTIARDAARDIHPPLYYWLLSGWLRLVGTGEAAVRSLSALLGLVLVALTYALGSLLAGRWAGLVAALLAATNPFQVYYSQETRMYMLLAVLSALAFYAALRWATSELGEKGYGWSVLYVLVSVAGLYSHYAFSMVLLAVNLVILLYIGLRWKAQSWTWLTRPWWRWPGRWLALQALVALLFVPWLPTAYRQLTIWPRPTETYDLVAALSQICQLFTTGPAAPPWKETGWVLLVLLLSFYPSRRSGRLPNLIAYITLVVWLVVPIALILGLGLFKDAYLKFLLIASPAFCLLAGRLAAAPLRRKRQVVSFFEALICGFVALLLVGAAVHGLHHYYGNPAYARDDYRGIAAYVDAVGRPGDAILLNAPGQREVFSYYYHGDLPVYPLPESRPLDPVATESALAELVRPGGRGGASAARVFAVLWATDESDPERFIEGWLDGHTYKALDSWYGNVRLVVYAVPERTPNTPDHILHAPLQSTEAGDEITLLGYSLLNDRPAAGDIAQITLFWRADRALARRYKVFLHVLDEGNHIVGQRDAEPGGGARLTTLWAPGEVLADNYGVPIHPATPPGKYRVEVGMYNPETGQRLTTPDGADQLWLEPLAVEQPPVPAPIAALGMQHGKGADFGELTLLGYDLYKLGFDHWPDAPLGPGDVLHVNLYWRAETQPSGDWARVSITAEAVGGYPTSKWQAGDVWRGQFDLSIPGDVRPGRYRLRIQPITPGGTPSELFLSNPLIVE